MKKISVFLVVCLVGSFLFALDVETNVSLAYGHGLFWEKGSEQGIEAKSSIVAPGADISIASYFNNKNVGFYLNTAYNFPSKLTVATNNVTVKTVGSDYEWTSIISVILGATYKYDLNKITVFGSIGPHLAQTVLTTKYTSVLNWSFGIGGDVGLRFFPAERFYITGGSLFSYDFLTTGKVKTAYSTITRKGHYNFTSLVPYIGIRIKFSEDIK